MGVSMDVIEVSESSSEIENIVLAALDEITDDKEKEYEKQKKILLGQRMNVTQGSYMCSLFLPFCITSKSKSSFEYSHLPFMSGFHFIAYHQSILGSLSANEHVHMWVVNIFISELSASYDLKEIYC